LALGRLGAVVAGSRGVAAACVGERLRGVVVVVVATGDGWVVVACGAACFWASIALLEEDEDPPQPATASEIAVATATRTTRS
jgi:hypothetical protein